MSSMTYSMEEKMKIVFSHSNGPLVVRIKDGGTTHELSK